MGQSFSNTSFPQKAQRMVTSLTRRNHRDESVTYSLNLSYNSLHSVKRSIFPQQFVALLRKLMWKKLHRNSTRSKYLDQEDTNIWSTIAVIFARILWAQLILTNYREISNWFDKLCWMEWRFQVYMYDIMSSFITRCACACVCLYIIMIIIIILVKYLLI